MIRFCEWETPLGRMLLAARGDRLCGAWFAGQKYFPPMGAGWLRADDALLRQACRELDEYFAGRRRRFSVALEPRGTPFQRRVWRALADVAYGATVSYGELARRLGQPDAARAVGAAVGRNALTLFVACHRAVGGDGSLTGYAGGLARKRALLDLERGAVSAASLRGGGLFAQHALALVVRQ